MELLQSVAAPSLSLSLSLSTLPCGQASSNQQVCGAGGDQGRGWDSELNWTELQSGLCRGFCPSFRKCQGLVVLLRTLLPAPAFLIYDYGLCHLSVGPKSPELSRDLPHSLPICLSLSLHSPLCCCCCSLSALGHCAFCGLMRLAFHFLLLNPPPLPFHCLPCFALLLDWAIT